jgi:hypothetical protein
MYVHEHINKGDDDETMTRTTTMTKMGLHTLATKEYAA